MAAGPRSLLAFWAGGAGAVASGTQAGVRGLLAPWIGGAGATAPAEQAAVSSLLAFWLGGAAAGAAVEPPAPAPSPGLIGSARRHRVDIPGHLTEKLRRQLIEEDEVIAMVLLAALPGLLRRH